MHYLKSSRFCIANLMKVTSRMRLRRLSINDAR